MTDRMGQQLGNYQLIRLLGEGGFAEVYLGEHIHLGTQAAIKVLHTQLTSDDVDKFRTEARTIARLIHPHIVRVLEFGVEGKTPFLVMDYAPNGTLRQRHPKGVAIPLPLIVAYVKQVADALQYAHDEKLIHRDIKPENMLLGRRNEILLSDFGIALVAQSSRYQSAQEMAGTMAYMAPEQIQGKPRPASDQYSLGIVVYEWLSGDRPFHGSLTELVGQHLSVPPPSLQDRVSTILPEVDRVVLMALAKDPKQRFASIQAFATALEEADQLVQQASSVVASPLIQLPQSEVEAPSLGQPPLTPDTVAIIQSSPSSLSANIDTPPSQSLQSTNRVTPPSQSVQSNDRITRSANPRVSPGLSREPVPLSMPQFSKRSLSRRAVVAGLVGLAAIGVGGGIAWRTHSQGSLVSSPSSHVKSTPTSVSTTPSPVPAGTTLLTYHGHSDGVTAVVWSPDGKRIASACANFWSRGTSKESTVQVWDADTGSLVFTYRGHSGGVYALAWSPDGKRIASGGADLTVQVWDAATGGNHFTYEGHTNEVRRYANGLYGIATIAWSPDSKRIASASYGDPGTVQVWDAATGGNHFTYEGQGPAAWSPNGKYIVSASLDLLSEQVWDATSSGNPLVTYNNHPVASNVPAAVEAVGWSHDNARIASGGNGGLIEVWNATAANHLITYHSDDGQVYTVSWAPNDKTIASGGNSQTVQMWTPTTGNTLYTYRGHSGSVRAVAWSPDGKHIASGSDDTTVQVWQAV